MPGSASVPREGGDFKAPTKPNCCFNHLGDSDHRQPLRKRIHFWGLVKMAFRTAELLVCGRKRKSSLNVDTEFLRLKEKPVS